MSSVEQGLGASLVVGGDTGAGGGGNLFPVANATSIVEFILSGSGGQTIVPQPPLGTAHLLVTLGIVNGDTVATSTVEIVNFNSAPIASFDIPGTGGNFPVVDVLGTCPVYVSNFSGPTVVKVLGPSVGSRIFGEYVTFNLGSNNIQEGILQLTTAYQPIPNIATLLPGFTSAPFSQTWSPGLPSQLGFVWNGDVSANQIRFRLTRGFITLEFDGPSLPAITRTPLKAPFPALIAGDTIEAKLLSAETNVGQNFLTMVNQIVPV